MHNVLANKTLQQGLKEYSSWPTCPWLYIDSEFFGGCDITVGREGSREAPATFQRYTESRTCTSTATPATQRRRKCPASASQQGTSPSFWLHERALWSTVEAMAELGRLFLRWLLRVPPQLLPQDGRVCGEGVAASTQRSCSSAGRCKAQLRRGGVVDVRCRKRPLRLDGVQAQPRRPLSTASATTSLAMAATCAARCVCCWFWCCQAWLLLVLTLCATSCCWLLVLLGEDNKRKRALGREGSSTPLPSLLGCLPGSLLVHSTMPLTNKASDPVCSVRLGCLSAWVVGSFLSADGRYKTRAMVNGQALYTPSIYANIACLLKPMYAITK